MPQAILLKEILQEMLPAINLWRAGAARPKRQLFGEEIPRSNSLKEIWAPGRDGLERHCVSFDGPQSFEGLLLRARPKKEMKKGHVFKRF